MKKILIVLAVTFAGSSAFAVDSCHQWSLAPNSPGGKIQEKSCQKLTKAQCNGDCNWQAVSGPKPVVNVCAPPNQVVFLAPNPKAQCCINPKAALIIKGKLSCPPSPQPQVIGFMDPTPVVPGKPGVCCDKIIP